MTTISELRFATRIVMARHRVITWQPRPVVKAEPAFVPEWLRRGAVVKDMTRSAA